MHNDGYKKASGNFRLVVHQAAGIVAAQLEVPIAEALLRLRARAYSSGRLVSHVAADVVARRLRFSHDNDD